MTAIVSRPTALRALATLLLGGVMALMLAGCGDSKGNFTRGEAARALALLDGIEEDVVDGRCASAIRGIGRISLQAARIDDKRPELGEAWAVSAGRLKTLVTRECVEIVPEGPTPEAPTAPTGPTEQPEPTKPVEPPKDDDKQNDQTDDGGSGTRPQGNDGGGGEKPSAPDESGGAGPGA